ncbi:hypothetical protein AOLI_G00149970 [Acnodon oligacanthus]
MAMKFYSEWLYIEVFSVHCVDAAFRLSRHWFATPSVCFSTATETCPHLQSPLIQRSSLIQPLSNTG